jgi:hypothetical protein
MAQIEERTATAVNVLMTGCANSDLNNFIIIRQTSVHTTCPVADSAHTAFRPDAGDFYTFYIVHGLRLVTFLAAFFLGRFIMVSRMVLTEMLF